MYSFNHRPSNNHYSHLKSGIIFFVLSLCLACLNQPAQAQLPSLPIHEQLPDEPEQPADSGTYTVSETYTSGSLDHWAQDGLTRADERGVFRASLTYQGDGKNDFEVRMGEGGQFYSLITPLGELIGRQHTYATSFSRWNDAVLESVVTNTNDPRVTSATCTSPCNANLVLNKNPDMNQGGTYIRDGLTDPFYSPHLRFERPGDHETRSIIWTTPSALPTTFQSGILYDQRTRNMGDGVLEITQLISNFGPDTLENRQTIPWLSLSGAQLDGYSYRGADGLMVDVPNAPWNGNIVRLEDTNGWLMFVDDDHPDQLGFVVITGGEKYAYGGDEKVWTRGWYRFGDLNRPQWPDDTEYILSSSRSLNLYVDETVFFRYYIAFGPKSALIALADQYTDAADYGQIAYTETSAADAGVNPICVSEGRYHTVDCSAAQSVAALYDYQVDGSKPVFVLRNTVTDQYVYTFDPYAISRVSDSEPGPFYDGTTEYVEMLGWAVHADTAALSADSYVPISAEGSVTGDFSGLDGFLFRYTAPPTQITTSHVDAHQTLFLAIWGNLFALIIITLTHNFFRYRIRWGARTTCQ